MHDLDLLGAANPVGRETLKRLELGAGAAELCDALIACPRAAPATTAARRPRRTRRVTAPRTFGSLAAAGVLAVVLVFTLGRQGGDGATAWAAPLVKLAESSPLVLVDAPGWTVTRMDEQDAVEGEMSFANGDHRADLSWRRGSLAMWQDDRRHGAALVVRRNVLGAPAQVAEYAGSHGEPLPDFTAIWPEHGRVLELRANSATLAEFEALLAALARVDVDRWLSAMPASVVKVGDRAGVVEAMVADIPLPPGFDLAALKAEELARDRYQLGAEVTAAVGCTWIKRWDDARRRGDDARAQQAIAAMASSHHWKVLDQMQAEGAWPEIFREMADAMRGDGTYFKRPLTDAVQEGLGCARWWK